MYLYVIRRADVREIKIGVTRYPKKRLQCLQVGSARPLELLVAVRVFPQSEGAVHRHFAAHRISGEWFHECPEIMEWVARLQAVSETADPRRAISALRC